MKNSDKIIITTGMLIFLIQMSVFYFGYVINNTWMNDFYFLSEKYYTWAFVFFIYRILPKQHNSSVRLLFLNLKELLLLASIFCLGRLFWVILKTLGFIGIVNEKLSFYFILIGIGIFTVFLFRKYFFNPNIRK